MRQTCLLLLSLLIACSSDRDSVRQRFLAQSATSVRFENWVRAFNNQDLDSLALGFHQVAELRVLLADGTISRGWDEERRRQVEFFDSAELVNFVPEGLEIEVIGGEVVLTNFRYSLDVERAAGERDPTVTGRGTIVWISDPADDAWKIHLMHLSKR